MDSYQKMYYMLFNAVTNVIDELQAVQAQTEEIFLSMESGQGVFDLFDEHKNTE